MEKCDFHNINNGECHWCNKVIVKDASEFLINKTSELDRLKAENARLREALGLIAIPVRSDGTYNRSREACEQLAREALKGAE